MFVLLVHLMSVILSVIRMPCVILGKIHYYYTVIDPVCETICLHNPLWRIIFISHANYAGLVSTINLDSNFLFAVYFDWSWHNKKKWDLHFVHIGAPIVSWVWPWLCHGVWCHPQVIGDEYRPLIWYQFLLLVTQNMWRISQVSPKQIIQIAIIHRWCKHTVKSLI